jgi:hypothetical protein
MNAEMSVMCVCEIMRGVKKEHSIRNTSKHMEKSRSRKFSGVNE